MEAVKTPKTRIHAAWPTWSVVVALALLFLGERVLGADGTLRGAFAVVTGGLVLAAVVQRVRELGTATEEKKWVAKTLLFATLGVLVGLALYAPLALGWVAEDARMARGALWALFPVVLAVSTAPLVAIELAVSSVAFNPRYEQRRIRQSLERSVALSLLLSSLFLGNFLANRHDTKWDLSQGQKARTSEATTRTVRDLSEPVTITLFFPRANEVAEAIEPYFESVKSLSPNVTVRRVDHALAGDLAKEASVTENGVVLVSKGKTQEKVRIGEKMSGARSAIRKLDQSFLTALLKVTREKKVAYFTTGHEERSLNPDSKDTRSSLKLLKQLLEANQYTVKPFGVADGLATEVPTDGSLIFVMGPEKPFSPAEIEAINRAVEKGGARLFVALEAEREGEKLAEILGPLGVEFDKTVLANERSNIPFTRTKADSATIWSNRFSSHESVTTMTRNAKLATVFDKTGSLAKAKTTPDKVKVDLVLTAVDDTFADANGNFTLDADEKKAASGLAAAVTRTSTSGKKSEETRVFVTADVDVFADELIKFEGNVRFLADIVYWLRAIEEPVVPAVSEADVQIVHKKEEDALVFYSTTLGVPALVLALGFARTRRRSRS